jgi:F-type H+-transporting ATPase subunit b
MQKLTDQKLAEYNSALRAARTEGYQLLEKERSQAVREKEEKVRVYKEEISATLAEDIRATHDQEKEGQRQLEAEAETLGAMITSQILRR